MKKYKRLSASLSIEAAYTMSIALFSISFLINIAYRENARVVAGYISHIAAEELAHMEDDYMKDEYNKDMLDSRMAEYISNIAALNSADFFTKQDLLKASSGIKKINWI